MKYSCCVLLAWFLCVVSLGWAQLWEGDTCRQKDRSVGVCRMPDDCPGIRETVAARYRPTICSHKNKAVIICCSNPISTNPQQSSKGDPTTTTTDNAQSRFGATTSMVDNSTGPTTSMVDNSTGPTTSMVDNSTGPTTSMVDNSTKAGQKCHEYGRYVYRNVPSPSLRIPRVGEHKVEEKIDECVMGVETLIVGGEIAIRKEFPHMVSLGYGRIEDVQWQCGGSLISERFVVTAAHCLSSQNYGAVSFVRLGHLHLDMGEDNTLTIAVDERIKHEGYIPPAHYNDIALLKLKENVTFSPYIRPACLHTVPGNPQGKPKATAIGFGKLLWDAQDMSKDLMKVDLAIQDESRCNYTYRKFIKPLSSLKNGITPDSMICAGDPKGEKDTCQGDSGGPLQIRLTSPDPYCMYSIIGLVSFGTTSCGAGDAPAVYTRVSNYIPWIENHVWPQTE